MPESYGQPLKEVKISIPVSAYETLQEYKRLAGVSPASFVRQVVLEAEPSLKEINDSLRQFQDNRSIVAMETLGAVLMESQQKVSSGLNDLVNAAKKKEASQ